MRIPGETLYAVVSVNGKMGGMRNVGLRLSRGVVPLSVLAGVVVLVALGFGRGIWLSNLHNGLLALSFAAVGTYVSTQRPRNHAGALFLATGAVEAVLFFGRQVGHDPASSADRWWAWLGVWPLALALALTTLAIICFPTGRLPSRRWRPVALVIVVLASICALLSALWPVEYQSAGIVALDPVNQEAPAAIGDVWKAIAHPTYVVLQLLWIVALASRWRNGDAALRSQLSLLLVAAAVSVAALAIGLIAFGTHVPGVLAATMVPIAAGWAIVHGRQLAAYRALSWLSRTAALPADLPDEMARTTAEALGAPGATLWMGDANLLHAAGVWPRTQAPIAALSIRRARRRRRATCPRAHQRSAPARRPDAGGHRRRCPLTSRCAPARRSRRPGDLGRRAPHAGRGGRRPPATRPPGRPHPPRARGARAHGPGPHQPRHLREALPQRQDRRAHRQLDIRQARSPIGQHEQPAGPRRARLLTPLIEESIGPTVVSPQAVPALSSTALAGVGAQQAGTARRHTRMIATPAARDFAGGDFRGSASAARGSQARTNARGRSFETSRAHRPG